MRRLAGLVALLALAATGVQAAEPDNTVWSIRSCIIAAAAIHRLPPAVLIILLNVEGGTLGAVSQNTNDTVDIGPMQVNQIWLPQVAAHWHASTTSTYRALRDNFCANVEAGAWILRRGLDEAHGDFWEGVGIYHSHDSQLKATYLRAVLKQALRLQAATERADSRPQPPAPVSSHGLVAQGY